MVDILIQGRTLRKDFAPMFRQKYFALLMIITTIILISGPTGASAQDQQTDGRTVVLDTIVLIAEDGVGPVNGIIASRSASGTKTDTPIIETPQTVTVIPRDQFEQQGATTITETLRYSSGVISGTNGGQSGRFDSYFVRGAGGFSADANNANTVDGLRWRIPGRSGVQYDQWMIERVEVVKGPSATLFGSGSTGGVVNLVTKRPQFTPSREVFTAIDSWGKVETGLDVTGPINDRLAYRIIALGRKGDTFIDEQHDERFLIAPSLTWKPREGTTITLQALYQRDPISPDANFITPYGSVLPIPGYGKVDPGFWQGDTNYREYSRKQRTLGWQIDHEINENWSFHSGFRWGRMQTTSKSLDYAYSVGPVIYRNALLAVHDTESTSTDNYVTGKLSLGPTEHTVLAGVDYQKLSKDWQNGSGFPNVYPLDITAPVRGVAVVDPVATTTIKQPFEQTGIYLQDQISYGKWRILGSLRHDWLNASNGRFNIATGLGSSQSSKNEKTTWRLGTVYMMDSGYAPFISYSTSFEPQLGLKADGSRLQPSNGRMLEAGIRFAAPDTSLTWSVTAFTGERDKFAVGDSVNQAQCLATTGAANGCQTDGNKVRYRGVELEAKAQMSEGVDVIGAVTFQNVRLTESSDIGINPDIVNGDRSVNKHMVGVPDHYASLWVNYKAPEGRPLNGWTFGGGVRYIGSTYGTTTNVWGASEGIYAGRKSKVPSFTLIDAAVGYDFGARYPDLTGLEAKLTVHNLLDKGYVASCNGYGTCSFGEERTARLAVAYKW
ncbi:MAG: hypothetical protein DI498_10320 [Paracoccus denitrificans]|nr:MAG: hypothetical protein DI498_10320 [Paracoccus denitrificans]PZO83832.1 MAG: hypothetical protein DI633_10320 [Paracoccus denitrificans]